MAAEIIDGKAIAEEIRNGLTAEVAALKKKTGREPCLAVVLVGENPASKIYVNMKDVACGKTGIKSKKVHLPDTVSGKDLINHVRELAGDEEINGILVQLPLPKHISEQAIIEAIPPEKDVDGLHPVNMGKLFASTDPLFIPATPKGVMELVRRAGAKLEGAQAVVVGRSNLVGKPAAALLLNANATVTLCHSRTKDLAGECAKADILIAAVGKPGIITAGMVKPGAVVIDVGTTKVDGKLMGDVDFDSVKEKAGALTPVPGGVGPMTIAMLLDNTVIAFKRQNGLLG